jgi:DNA-binding CsgD family transcriptional regulator
MDTSSTTVASAASAFSGVSSIVLAPCAMARERRRRPRRSEDRGESLLADLGRWFLNCQVRPHLLMDRSQRVLAMNRPAQQLLKGLSSIALRGASLRFSNPRHAADVARVMNGDTDGVSFNVPRATGVLSVRIVRVQPSSTLFLLSMAAVTCDSLERLRFELGLTPAESEIAFSVYSGLSLVRISRERGASINTVKTQARHVFQKCGVQSQVELTRRVGQVLTGS